MQFRGINCTIHYVCYILTNGQIQQLTGVEKRHQENMRKPGDLEGRTSRWV